METKLTESAKKRKRYSFGKRRHIDTRGKSGRHLKILLMLRAAIVGS